jgi:hypothetical protein
VIHGDGVRRVTTACRTAVVLLGLGLVFGLATPTSAAVPTVPPGGILTEAVDGFAPHSAVTEHLVGQAATSIVHADGKGTVHVVFRVPTATGHYRLTLVGRPALPSDGRPRQNVVVVVPRIAVLDFVVGQREPGGGHGQQGGQSHHGNGGLSGTGVDIEALLYLALFALASGLIFEMAGCPTVTGSLSGRRAPGRSRARRPSR